MSEYYNNIDNIMSATFDELVCIPEIGDIIAKSIVDYFNDSKNIELINKLKENNLNMNYIGIKKNIN